MDGRITRLEREDALTIPAPLPPPAAAAIDAAVAYSGVIQTRFRAGLATQLAVNSFDGTVTDSMTGTLTATVLAWTNHDGTMGLSAPGQYDPAANGGDTVTARGLIAEYGAVVARVYEWNWSVPSIASLVAPDAVQAAANDPATWTAPE